MAQPRTSWSACFLASILYAIFFVLPFPPIDWWPTAFWAVFPLVMLAVRCHDGSRWRMVVVVWLMSTLAFLWHERWLTNVSVFGYPILAMYLAVYPAAFVWIISLVRSRDRGPAIPGAFGVILVPTVWVALEFMRGSIIGGGYPWYLIAHPAIGATAFVQSADLLGTYFVSFLVVMFAGLLADLLTVPVLRRGRITPSAALVIGLFGVIEIGALVYGVVRLRGTPSLDDETGVTTISVAAIQSDVWTDNKVDYTPAQQLADFKRLAKVTIEAQADAKARGVDVDLVAWPETSIPGAGMTARGRAAITNFESEHNYSAAMVPNARGMYYYEGVRWLAQSVDAPILVGASVPENVVFTIKELESPDTGRAEEYIVTDFDERFNSTVMFKPDGTQAADRYDKIYLTPFGEVMPIVRYWPWLEQKAIALAAQGMPFDLTAGTDVVRFQVEGNAGRTLTVATPICFESSVPRACRRLVHEPVEGVAKADLLLTMTNDGWFGHDPGGRERHFQIGRFRCIENRVPMARSANTGVSGAIDSAGRIVQWGLNAAADAGDGTGWGGSVATLALDGRWTLYSKIGDAFAWLCLAVTTALTAIAIGIHRRRRCSPAAPSTADVTASGVRRDAR